MRGMKLCCAPSLSSAHTPPTRGSGHGGGPQHPWEQTATAPKVEKRRAAGPGLHVGHLQEQDDKPRQQTAYFNRVG
uniref:Uncharacterized protein n=1 Tax=Anser cygnoides TaxID=8845 RepID=A0A8B9EN09_ANSCY